MVVMIVRPRPASKRAAVSVPELRVLPARRLGQQPLGRLLLLERRLRGGRRFRLVQRDGGVGEAVDPAVRPAGAAVRLEIELGLLLDGRRHRLARGCRRQGRHGGGGGGCHLGQDLPLEVEEEVDGPEVGVVADVGPAADDGDALEAREGDGEGDADVGADPEEAARGRHGRDVDGALRLRDLARRQHARDVGGDVDVLQVPEGLRVVQADRARVLQRNPQSDACCSKEKLSGCVCVCMQEIFLQT